MVIRYIVFRVDATSQIGTGHFMRCLTLADALKQHGAQIRFVSRNLPEHLQTMLLAKDIEFVALESNITNPTTDNLAHSHWLGCSQIQDAQATLQALSDQSWDWLIVDHYALDIRWESILKPHVKKILVIDDLADRVHDCDILLDQNYYADMETRYLGKVPAQCQLLLSPRYALLRDEFQQQREQIKPRSGTVKRILVFFGGVDADNYTGLAIDALATIAFSEIQIDVVIGAGHPYRDHIKTACAERGFNCHIQTDKMAQLMAKADLAIGAGGSATWERCCLGLPAIILVIAENQAKAANDLANAGVFVNLGDAKLISPIALADAVKKLINNPTLRSELSTASLNLVPYSNQHKLLEIMAQNYV